MLTKSAPTGSVWHMSHWIDPWGKTPTPKAAGVIIPDMLVTVRVTLGKAGICLVIGYKLYKGLG